ncbi:deoxyribonuclease/rho motif-related TRAM [Methanocaldococcus bathoardescens]|uniref:Deoxyribonuclease/rho motif-related TRAM n=1 Tax=Methanocaldococcus bathoardescens TaxID=1301915 RepID=A0A076LD25_9EURY|nr:TRAM domain-containing protein [Methanocaldococcus bathoardescens]AIJ06081.1 deoxyribonuclease/rho motif-related TRAM [Methanocaldococcus bathoardescens]
MFNNKGRRNVRNNEIRRNVPVKEGETYTVTIEDMGRGGDGIARVEGFVVFVPETQKGDTVDVKITAVKSKFAFAEKI